MSRLEFESKMAWAGFWINIWGIIDFLGFSPSLDNSVFRWIVSQTGFIYARWEDASEYDE